MGRGRSAVVAVAAVGVLVAAAVGGAAGFASYRNRCRPPETAVTTIWLEENLDAIRADFPAPTVHARNLFHLSATMWDVWAAYEPDATGVFVDEARASADVEGDRFEAISFAAHRLLNRRYVLNSGDVPRLEALDQTLASLCLDPTRAEDPESPAAFGVRVAETILEMNLDDGSGEIQQYKGDTHESVNPPLVVDESGTTMSDPNRWQALSLARQVTQNGQVLPPGLQTYIGPTWGFVTPFAIDADPADGLPFDPGPPPYLESDRQRFIADAAEIVELTSRLDSWNTDRIDISPAVQGDVALGGYEAVGRPSNPATGEPYEPNPVPTADFGRVIAEYWADGPDSETPPGHWNTLAIGVGDDLEADDALTIDGRPVDRVEWDVKMGLALNGALHDTAIAVWGAKAHYDYARPISMIRYLGERAELPETPGLIEPITEESSAPGERHVHLSDYVGEQAIYSWLGEPSDPRVMLGGVAWIRAADFVPYQRASFVSPAFAAYVSGHSGFSRAAAEVLTELTGSEYFPGGMETHTVEPGGLIHEQGPTETVTLQWATYRDAADQAGLSRLWGGIHVRSDDLNGRRMGAEIGVIAADHARTFFG